jgi:RNA polymerase sigma-70 factor (ECF subfamily)
MPAYQTWSDEDLLVEYGRNQTFQAFETLVWRHEKPLYNYILRAIGHDVPRSQELLQEVFMALHENAPRYEPNAKFTTYAYRIARNKCVDELRARKSMARPKDSSEWAAVPQLVEGASTLEESSDWTRFRAAVNGAIARLPPDLREAFVLKHGERLSFQEVAARTECKPRTAQSRVRLARERLRSELAAFAGLIEGFDVDG